MRLAVLSDIHGNLQALEAVLADIDRKKPDVVWCGGDLVGYGANPNDVIAEVRGRGIPTVMGNYDDGIGYFRIACGCDYPDEAAMQRGLRSIAWTKQQTSPESRAFLRNLPYLLQRDIEGLRVVLVHASPAALNEYVYEEVPDETLRGHLESTRADVLIFGHTHKPYHKVLDGRHLVNSGSVGKPKHGSPNATYAWLTLSRGRVAVELVEVEYDHEAAARAVEATDLPHELAQMLREGRG